MGRFLSIALVFIVAAGIAQEASSVIIMPLIMKKKEVALIIKEKNDSELNKLVVKSRLFKNFQPIGFAAIPAGFFGAVSLSGSTPSDRGRRGSTAFKQTAGLSLLALSAICLTSSVYFNIQSGRNYKKAIQKYNQNYN